MPDSINFLKLQHRKVTKQQELDQKLFKIALGSFGGVIAITLLAVGLSFFFQYRLGNAQDRSKDLERQVLSHEEVEKSAIVIIEKISVLQELLDKRQDKQQAIEYFTNLFGGEVVVEDINYQAADSLLSLRIQIPSVFLLERVFELLALPTTKEAYQVSASELRRDAQGTYSMSLVIALEDSTATKPTQEKK